MVVLLPVVLVALAFLALVLSHRVVTAAEAAAYACAGVAASEPLRGEELGREAALRSLRGWSGVALAGRVEVDAGRAGRPVRCRVEVEATLPGGLGGLGLGRYAAEYVGASEALRGRW